MEMTSFMRLKWLEKTKLIALSARRINLLTKFMLVLALQCMASVPAFADKAGTVEFVSGTATAISADGKRRTINKGDSIESGESIETTTGRVQLRMIDTAYISLQPDTTFKIEDYTLPSSGKEEKGFLRLVKGGLRTITGLIGRHQRNAYRIQTATATIGIRGTEFAATHDDTGTRVNVTDGIVALCTSGGCIDIFRGQSGYAPTETKKPMLSFVPAKLPPVENNPTFTFVAGDERASDGQPASILYQDSVALIPTQPIIPIATGTVSGGLGVAFATSDGFTAGLVGYLQTFNTSGALTDYLDCCGWALTGGVPTDFGADGIIAWGRWTGGNSTNPGVGGSITHLTYYSILNSLTPTVPSIVRAYASFASTAPVATSAGGVVNFVGTTNSVTGSLNVNFTSTTGGGTLSYILNVPIAGQTFTVNGSASQFSSYGFLGSSSTITSTGSGCAATCLGTIQSGDAIQGSFTGTNAERAGANYGFSTSIGNVSGTIVFH